MDLAPYYQKFGWDSRINTAAIEGMTFEGVKADVPFISLGIGGWYNKALFKKAGISAPPTSYAELEEANEKILAAGITPLATGREVRLAHHAALRVPAGDHAGPELHDKLLVGQESWDRPEVVTAFTNFKKWQDKKWIPDGALGLDPSDVEPWYVQGKTAYTITGPWTEAAAIQAAKKESADFGVFQLPTDQTPRPALRLRRGLHDQRQVGEPGQGGGADRLHRQARHARRP